MPHDILIDRSLACTGACAEDPEHFTLLPWLTEQRSGALYHGLIATQGLPGVVAEVGAYRGDTSRWMAQYLARHCPEKRLHVFEGFHGLPLGSEHDLGDGGQPVPTESWKGLVAVTTNARDPAVYRATPEEFWETIGPELRDQ